MKNPFGKKTDIENPYAIYKAGDLEYRVLKTYKLAKNEDAYSRWFVAGKSADTFGSWEYGDMYAPQVKMMRLVECTDEWRNTYDYTSKVREKIKSDLASVFGDEIFDRVEVL